MMQQLGICLAMLLFVPLMATAAEDHPAFTDRAQAGPDFEVQGEYLGEIATDRGKETYGVQVIALGSGTFEAVAYPGGLPGAKADVSQADRANGKTVDGATTFVSEDGRITGVVRNKVLRVANSAGEELGSLAKADRVSPTLGAKPPAGATVLFDGMGTDHFANGEMTKDGLLKAGTHSKATFKNFKLHLEFRTPFMPSARGQARGNSGMYLQGRYEVQILDSFGLEGRDNECGGIYKAAAPRVNLCLPPLAWQTYDVDFTAARFDAAGKKTENARVTVLHNGVAIHDNLELPDVTPGGTLKTESPEPGPLFLQDHGNPVHFRNVWVVEKD
ncbi:MAG: DUF1080 domain-containing protein [Pirellulales bacterium]|nr:DUF1080 domain-containing protein [Pirellulales bacterium]